MGAVACAAFGEMGMKKQLLTIAAAALAAPLWSGAAKANPLTLTFEDGTVGNAVGSQYASDGATFTDAYFYQCGGGCPAPVNGIFVSSDNFADPLTVTFATLQTSVSFVNVSNSYVTADAYNSLGLLVASYTDNGPFSGNVDDLSGIGIAYVTFVPSGGGPAQFGIDDLTFNAGLAVPEPASFALLLAGLTGIGYARRRRAH
jgi:hypothetical protein